MTDPRVDACAARKAEQQRLLMYQRQRRLVYATYPADEAGNRAEVLDWLIADSRRIITALEDQICTHASTST